MAGFSPTAEPFTTQAQPLAMQGIASGHKLKVELQVEFAIVLGAKI
jgi:hypothetical protein